MQGEGCGQRGAEQNHWLRWEGMTENMSWGAPQDLHRNRSSSLAFHDLHQVTSKSIHSCPCHLHTQWLVFPGKVASIILCLGHLKPFSVMKIWGQCCPCSSCRLLAQSVLLFSPLDSVWHTKVTYSAWLLHRSLCARACHSNAKLLGWGNPTLPSIDLLGNDSFIGYLATQGSKGTCVWTLYIHILYICDIQYMFSLGGPFEIPWPHFFLYFLRLCYHYSISSFPPKSPMYPSLFSLPPLNFVCVCIYIDMYVCLWM